MLHVHLVRHGDVENPRRIVYGNLPGFHLSIKGWKQAEQMARYLVEKTGGKATLYSSPLERARDTAEAIRVAFERATGAPMDVNIDPRFTESVTWREGLPRGFTPFQHLRRALDPDTWRNPERARAIAARMRSAILDAARAAPGGHVIVATHRFSIWMARAAFEHGLGHGTGGRLAVRAFPWLHIREDVELASVTTLTLDGERAVKVEYAEPAGDERWF